MLVFLTRLDSKNARLTALPSVMARLASVRKPCAMKVESKAQAMPTSVNQREMSAGFLCFGECVWFGVLVVVCVF